MKQKLLNFTRLRSLVLLAVIAFLGAGQAWGTDVVDQLSKDDLAATGTSYTTFSDVQKNTAVYAGRTSVQNSSIGMKRDGTNGAGIFTTSSGGVAKSLSFTWTSTSNRTLQVWGKNSAYSLADTKNQNNFGTKIAEVTYDSNNTSPTLTLNGTDNYEYILIVPSNTSMLSITDVEITWEVSGGSNPSITANNVNIAYNATSGSIAYTLSNATGNVSATITNGDWLTLGNITSSAVPFTCSANTGTTARTATVTLSYTGASDKVVTVTQAANPNLSNIAALTAQSAGSYTVSLTDALVTYVNGTNAYLEDASGAVLLYHCRGKLAAGDKITGTADVTYTVYNNLPEVTAITLADGYTKTTGNTVTPTEVTIAALKSDYTSYLSRYVKIVGATVTSAFDNKNCTIEQSSSSIVLRDQNNNATLTSNVGDNVTVTAHPSIYNSTHQIAVYEQSQIVVAKADPTITFDNGSVRVGQNLDLSTLFESNSTGAVTYSITAGSDKASLDGSTLTGTAEGSVTVKAEQAESSSYNAGEATATITVNPALVLSSIAVTTAPTKTTYNVGENFDPTGMVVTATYSDNSTEAVTGYTYSPNGALTTSDTEITISYTENNVTKTATQAITVNEVVDYATLPFEYDGNGLGELPAGLTQNDLTDKYNDSPKMKFDGTGDYLILKFNERPGKLTFDIKGNSFSSSTFKVQTSVDGETYTDLETYTKLGAVQNEEFDNLNENVRYIKWIYTNKSGGNVALGNIALAKYVEPGNYDLTVATLNDHINAIFVFNASDQDNHLIANGAAGTVQVASGTEILVSPDVADGYVLESLMVDGTDVSSQLDGSGAYTFTMPASNVTITATATAGSVTPPTGGTYVKVTSTDDLTDGQYLIVYEEGNVAFNGGLETLDAASNTIGVTISNSEIAVTSATEAAEFTINVTAGTIKSSSGYYIGRTNDTNGMNSSTTEAYTNTLSIDVDKNAEIISAGGAYLRYNATSGQDRFRYFKSSSYTNQKAIQLYKKVAPATESITVGAAGYTTYVTQNDVSFPSSVKAYIVTAINNKSIHLEEVLDAPADAALVIKATAGTYDLESEYAGLYDEQVATTPNLLLASDGSVTGDGTTIWALAMFNNKVGFNVVGNGVTIPAGKAYLVIPSEIKGFLTFDFDSEDAIKGVEAISENGVIFNLAGQRVNKAQKGIYIINGKKVLVK